MAVYGAVRYQGSLSLNINGTTAGTGYDQLSHFGNVVVGGTLDVIKGGSFVPTAADRFTLIKTSGTLSGQFSTVNLPHP